MHQRDITTSSGNHAQVNSKLPSQRLQRIKKCGFVNVATGQPAESLCRLWAAEEAALSESAKSNYSGIPFQQQEGWRRPSAWAFQMDTPPRRADRNQLKGRHVALQLNLVQNSEMNDAERHVIVFILGHQLLQHWRTSVTSARHETRP